ncbi:MAG: DHHW family protein [Chitinivibrionia bacterium]|nr:DHHW family protein [Chitinivibrionia bacterium]
MRKATAMILVGFLILIMISVIVRIVTWDVLIKKFNMDNVITRAIFFDADEVFEERERVEVEIEDEEIPFDAKKEYPFTKNKPSLVDTSALLAEDERKEEFDTATVIGKIKKHIHFFLKERLLPYNTAVELALRYEGGLNWNVNENAILVGNNYWVFGSNKALASKKASISRAVISISDFNQFLQTKNIPLLYIAVPGRISPDSIYNFINQENIEKDYFLSELRNLEIPFLDLRENIRAENKDWHSLFYNTDHHWKVETGLWASKIIAEKLNADFGFDSDVSLLEPENYDYKIYKNWFLGSIGKKVGHVLAKPDDFTLITPKFETKFDVLRFSSSSYYNGFARKKEDVIFDSVFIYYDVLNKKNYYHTNTYGSYMNGDNCAFIHNKLNSDGKKIMMLSESNGNVVVPFLSILTQYFVDIDLRHFNGSLETLIEKENPDIVIVAYYVVNAGKLFDFR